MVARSAAAMAQLIRICWGWLQSLPARRISRARLTWRLAFAFMVTLGLSGCASEYFLNYPTDGIEGQAAATDEVGDSEAKRADEQNHERSTQYGSKRRQRERPKLPPITHANQDNANREMVYTVQPGDNLYLIAWAFELDDQELIRLNKLQPPYTLQAGDKILLQASTHSVAHQSSEQVAKAAMERPVGQYGQPGLERLVDNVKTSAYRGAEIERIGDSNNVADISDATKDSLSSSLPGSTQKRVTQKMTQGVEQKTGTVVPSRSSNSPSFAKSSPPLNRTQPSSPSSAHASKASYPPKSTPAPSPRDAALAAIKSPSQVINPRGKTIWAWPVTAMHIHQKFAQTASQKGMELRGEYGQSIYAACDGKVVYSGNSVNYFDNLIIIKHSNQLMSAYGYNAKNLVQVGQTVLRGQKIAIMGYHHNHPALYFEIRSQGQPIDPASILPRPVHAK